MGKVCADMQHIDISPNFQSINKIPYVLFGRMLSSLRHTLANHSERANMPTLRASLGLLALAGPAMIARADVGATNATAVIDYVPQCAVRCYFILTSPQFLICRTKIYANLNNCI